MPYGNNQSLREARINHFDGILEFVSVAECNGFSAAARQLNVSASHVSRQVARLEQRLNCALVARTTRSVKLTSAGQQYYQQCRELLDGLAVANEQLSQQQVNLDGLLRISAAGAFAETVLAEALVEFALLHPSLELELNFNSRMVNFVEEGFDFAIRYGRLDDSGLVARKLVERKLVAVASKAYLAKYGEPTHPEQLKQHRCLISNNAGWRFENQGQELNVRVNGNWRSNNARVVVQACKAGLGIAYMPRSSFLGELDSGDLQPILEPYWLKHGLTSWIVYQNRRFLPLRARLAIDFLLARFADWQE